VAYGCGTIPEAPSDRAEQRISTPRSGARHAANERRFFLVPNQWPTGPATFRGAGEASSSQPATDRNACTDEYAQSAADIDSDNAPDIDSDNRSDIDANIDTDIRADSNSHDGDSTCADCRHCNGHSANHGDRRKWPIRRGDWRVVHGENSTYSQTDTR